MDHDCCEYYREFTASDSFSVNVYFFSLEQSDINTLDTAIKSNTKDTGDEIFLGIHLPNLIWYSNLSSINEQGRTNRTCFILLSFLLAKTFF